jgi:hypothetical protein
MSKNNILTGPSRKEKGRYLEPHLPKLSMGKDGRGGGTHYTPWLVIRYTNDIDPATGLPLDDGTRSLPAGTVFWESPNVWVQSSLGINQPVPGQPNTVYTRIANLGLEDATGVVVEFWWANPSLAITEANAHKINMQTLPPVTVPAQSNVVVTCPDPWIPIVENNGHECLLAQAYIPAFDNLTAPLDPVDDRHVGQKNEQLVQVPPGGQMRIHLDGANISGMAQALTFDVQPLRTRTLPTPLVRHALRHAGVQPPTATLPLSMKLHDASTFIGPSALFARRLLSTTLQEIAGTATYPALPTQISHTASFAPWELRRIEITAQIPADARPGESFAFRVVQRTGNLITGGYTVYVVVAGG